ncbi:hypothetical protein BZG36_03275 [Bifiguratus adelaidae]|uniref:Alpha 1,4-glycosyltransferase domain-containing protein n=1 Tax=Bifiguratus adelaidae TaxID=1938954 RepID=A0A261XZZ1_9FUNG|nr:hypothetical protein BZG36_03275 [Bifiguratus adelaidae]
MSLSTLNVPRRFHLPIIALRGLSSLPALVGIGHNLGGMFGQPVAYTQGDGPLPYDLRSVGSDYWIATLWCVLAGYWSWIFTTSMTRRWLYHYEISNAVIRLFTLTIVNWSVSAYIISHFGPDDNVWTWMVLCIILLICNIIKLVIGNRPEYHRKSGDATDPVLNYKSTAVKVLVMPFAFVTFITMLTTVRRWDHMRERSVALHQQYVISPLLEQAHSSSNHNLTEFTFASPDAVKVLVIVLSSWTPKAFKKRQTFRETTARLMPSPSSHVHFAYRFVLGECPSHRSETLMADKIAQEQAKYNDILIIPSSDLYNDLSRKVYSSLLWANDYEFDYLAKTDDDIFVRFDTLGNELAAQGKQSLYWQGLGYWDIPPIRNLENKNAAFDYHLPMFPPFTAGALYVLSRDVVHLVARRAPRLFTKNEDQNLGIWLFPHNIKPKHDRRIQQADVCEDDMIAKHFADDFDIKKDMYDMFDNVAEGRRLCHGFKQHFCALCYPCRGRSNHWRDWNFDCDANKGVTLLHQPPATAVVEGRQSVKDKMDISIMGKNDEWIIKGFLSVLTSAFSQSPDWHRLYWVTWTRAAKEFGERELHALESIWVHRPDAVVVVLSSTLSEDILKLYRAHGYSAYLVPINKEALLRNRWYLGPNGHTWLRDWDEWQTSPHFVHHLADYLKYLVLYRYGGTVMDLDMMWMQAPPNNRIEFVGADYTSEPADQIWSLEKGLYISTKVMKAQRGWAMFREVAEKAFAPGYNPDCGTCVGPRAMTAFFKGNAAELARAGFVVLPANVLYPVGALKDGHYWMRQLSEGSRSSHVPRSDIGISRSRIPSFPNIPPANYTLKLVLPERLVYSQSIAEPIRPLQLSESLPLVTKLLALPQGAFYGSSLMFIQGGPGQVSHAKISIHAGHGTIQTGSSVTSSKYSQFTTELVEVTHKDVNHILSDLVYSTTASLPDRLFISIEYQSPERQIVEGTIPIQLE